ncbi:MAG: redox-regulated ATPase YchF [Eubacteriaceae bacterium]|jgi:GTP-binding protein YchF|nr:redox-regulated ATPase YchF [Eubacteriaceae bacterium]
MKLGIVGLPNVGKSTLFNAITKAGAEAANYPFCTIEPNVGMVAVPDKRLEKLAEIYKSKKTIYTTIEFCDIAGLVKGASQGEGLGNQFLGHIRNVDAIVHVVRCFKDENVVHVDGRIDPLEDIEIINMELILSDMEVLDKRLAKAKKGLRNGDKTLKKEYDVMEKLRAHLADGKSARSLELDDEQAAITASFDLLSYKPVIYVANVSDDDAADAANGVLDGSAAAPGSAAEMIQQVREFAATEDSEVIALCAQLEEEISELEDDEREEFLHDLGIEESGLDKLVKASYHLLNLISFLTTGPDESRAWTIKVGTKAPQAAGKIHTDFEKGFIRAETINYDTLVNECGGSLTTAKEKGLLRSEGKEYVVKDGDILNILFNV